METVPTEGYSEESERIRVEQLPMSHLSIEVGHFLMTDLVRDDDRVLAQFRRSASLVAAFTELARMEHGADARVSTCLLIDDYPGNDKKKAAKYDSVRDEVLGRIMRCAETCGLTIDYLAREAACGAMPLPAANGGDGVTWIPLAEMIAARIVEEPAVSFNGSRDPARKSGWLCNGERAAAADEPAQAMRPAPDLFPKEYGGRDHSIFLDVEMWEPGGVAKNGDAIPPNWSCAFLAAIWQLLRLGMLRHKGGPAARPQSSSPETLLNAATTLPQKSWEHLPGMVRLNDKAKPFAAYRALSILPHRYVGVEHAVRVILDHVDVDSEIVEQLVESGLRELVQITVPRSVSDRLSYVMLDGC